jgi:hypothetical protein
MVHYLKLLSMLITVIFMTGCSIYRVYDAYEIADGGNKPSYKTSEIEAWMRFEDDNRFYSIGILGLPVIPTVIKIKDNKKLTIESTLRLNKECPFFIKTQPCLIFDNANKVCAREFTVDAVAMYQDVGTMYRDGKKRWHKLPEFINRTNLVVPLQGENRPAQVGQEEIYRHYAYTKQPAWEWLQIRFIYDFECTEKCPDKFRLDANNFLNLNNQQVIDGEYLYQRKRHYDYEFMTNIQ